MADISKVTLLNGTTYDLKDETARETLEEKADLISPGLIGTPTAPTAAAGTSTTQIATTAFVTTAIQSAMAGITQMSYSVVTTLPATGDAGTIYLVETSSGSGIYTQYLWDDDNNQFVSIGTTEIDLSEYVKWSDLEAISIEEINEITGAEVIGYDTYDGAYSFTPTELTQTIEINGKLAVGNITIDPIPTNYGRVSQSGDTLTIE